MTRYAVLYFSCPALVRASRKTTNKVYKPYMQVLGDLIVSIIHGPTTLYLPVLCMGENVKLTFEQSFPGAAAVVLGSIILAYLCL